MPAAVFPRTLKPTSVTPMTVPTGLVSVGHTGKAQLRAVTAMGRAWTETWAGLRAGDADVESFLAWIEWAYNTSKVFTIAHLTTPGSGRINNGGAVGPDPVVEGAGQTGETLLTDGWTGSAPYVKAGDVIRITGLSPLFRVTEDSVVTGGVGGHGTLKISPPIPVGSSPANLATIQYGGNTLNAYIAAPPNLPEIPKVAGLVFVGLSLTFREAV